MNIQARCPGTLRPGVGPAHLGPGWARPGVGPAHLGPGWARHIWGRGVCLGVCQRCARGVPARGVAREIARGIASALQGKGPINQRRTRNKHETRQPCTGTGQVPLRSPSAAQWYRSPPRKEKRRINISGS